MARIAAPLLLCSALAACAHAPAPRDALQQPEAARLAGEVVAVAYSGYRAGQHPDRGDGAVDPSDAELQEDLRILVRAGLRLIRLYDAGAVSARVLALIEAERLPLRVMLGAWLEAEVSNHEGCPWLKEPIPAERLLANAARNQAEVARVIALALAHPEVVVAVNVGNEALVSWNDHMVPMQSMLRYLGEVRAAIRQPVTTADNYVVWAEQGATLAPAVDFVAVHTYPAWEGRTAEGGLAFTVENLEAARRATPGLPIVIGEAGWPTVASEFGARASEDAQALYVGALLTWAKAHNVTTFLFEAFDEAWKGDPTDPLGAEKHWGLFTQERAPKPAAGLLP
jgi:exo-beta-1,3-glucanase (GH17 family)